MNLAVFWTDVVFYYVKKEPGDIQISTAFSEIFRNSPSGPDGKIHFSVPGKNVASLLEDDAVHLWYVSLSLPSSCLSDLYLTLSSDERQRCDRLRAETLKRNFIASHGILRRILGRYLQADPVQLLFSGETSGKPYLEDNPSCLNFNMSHSKDQSVYAVSRGRAVGIDLEKIRPVNNMSRLTKRFFSPTEHSHIISLTGRDREKAFFTTWVLKEAYLKATGVGLAGLGKLELFHTDTGLIPAPLIIKDRSGQSSQTWSALVFEPSPDYIAAVVAEGEHFNPCYYFESGC